MYDARILLDSVSAAGARLTTFVVTYPRFIHSEVMTHRDKSRNAASSRAIPVSKIIEMIRKDPVIPIYWGANQKGMAAEEEISLEDQATAIIIWLEARDYAIDFVEKLIGATPVDKYGRSEGEQGDYYYPLKTLNVHKQIANRLLEPFMWMTTLMTATEWDNFYCLRASRFAQPEFEKTAFLMAEEYYEKSKPVLRKHHLPFVQDHEMEMDLDILRKISVARCARVSYLNHEGKVDIQKDIERHNLLLNPTGSDTIDLHEASHISPFEHVASAFTLKDMRSGNFKGWEQYRKTIPYENRTSFDYEWAKEHRRTKGK